MENILLSPYADRPASQGYLDCLSEDIDILEAARRVKGLGRKAVETLNRLISWMTQYRRAMEHSYTHQAATDKANIETGLGTDLDAIEGFVQELKDGGLKK